jgi:hypothetical protein
MIRALSRADGRLWVTSRLGEALLAEGISGNPYFAAMAEGDRRLTAAAIRQADALRTKIAHAIGAPIGPVALGVGRKRGRESAP